MNVIARLGIVIVVIISDSLEWISRQITFHAFTFLKTLK